MGIQVETDSLAKTFRGRHKTEVVHALQGIDLTISPGELVSVLGPSGCGKTTLLRLIAGLETATAGDVKIGGDRVSGPYRNAGIVFQSDLLLPWRSALDNVLLQAQMRGLRRGDYVHRARELLEQVGVGDFHGAYPAALSGGMRQRVALCRAMLLDFPLLLMDEPFGALDALTRDQMALDLQAFVTGGPTALFITHSVEEAIFLSDRVVVMTPRPGRVHSIIAIDVPRPRTLAWRATDDFDTLSSQLRGIFQELGVLRDASGESSRAGSG